MLDPADLADFVPSTDFSFGRVRIPGVGVVTTEFIHARFITLWPIQSVVEVQTKQGVMMRPLPRVVWRSVWLAYARNLVGVFMVMGLLATILLVTSRWAGGAESWWIYGTTAALVLAFALSWWPFGSLGEAQARDVARRVGIASHHVERAFGRLSESEFRAAERQAAAERADKAAEQQARYQEGLAAARRRRAKKRATAGPKGRPE